MVINFKEEDKLKLYKSKSKKRKTKKRKRKTGVESLLAMYIHLCSDYEMNSYSTQM